MIEKKIALSGSTGQIGHAIAKNYKVIKLTSRINKDLTDLQKEIADANPDVIINCAAYTQVELAEDQTKTALYTNWCAPRMISELCAKTDINLIHFSSDYVYDGRTTEPYLEQSKANPINTYGASKFLGDLSIIGSGCIGSIFRTSWVVSDTGENFISKMLQLGMLKDSISVVDDQWGRPTTADLLASAALEASERGEAVELFHLTNSGEPTSWYELACFIFEQARDFGYPGIKASRLRGVSSEFFNSKVQRPQFSMLDCSKFDKNFTLSRPNWKPAVAKIVEKYVTEIIRN